MSSATPSSNITDDIYTLPASATAGVTDDDIAVLSRFLELSTSRNGVLPLQYPKRSIDDSQTGRTPGFERSRKVLDALVAIATYSSAQCLALSVSFGATVRITIAQNGEVPPFSVSQHLQSVWGQLGELAEMQRHVYSLPDVLNLRGESPKAAESHLSMSDIGIQRLKLLSEKLHADIHRHCYMKSKQRIAKYLSPWAEFYKFYRQTRAVFDPALVIADIVFFLGEISKMVIEYKGPIDKNGSPVNMDWYTLAKTSNVLLQMYLDDTINVRAKSNDVMAAWRSRSEVKANPDCYRFDLMRALEKTVTLSKHIRGLVSFAYSPSLRYILERQLDIRLLRPRTVELPHPSAERIGHIFEKAFKATAFAITRRIDEQELQDMLTDQLNLDRDTVLPPVSEHTVHAAYALLLQHHSESHGISNPPPLQYIAVNKLACYSCWSAYRGYTQITGRIFSLRGFHSKLSFPCCPTTSQFGEALGTAMRTYLYSQLVAVYSEHLNHIQDARNMMPDSTDNRLELDSVDEAAATREREEEEAGMDMGLE